ncbi:lysophospholipid acyltransferase family protein [Streptomyces paludis]|uniref:1-acyl-sn-glycerol-3-phosphate acyltransferase n=1 Tax=Streptomyces paludis TaxID=2282738 RepID=A0A345HXV7_9ACTN|nr:lysophospholipid acyltransferase family protein [Streptomyces paludis]AXG81531.1 1-acyl-sn-glycerol-3-phosphate acyltransferase [Streptomyces paludis]
MTGWLPTAPCTPGGCAGHPGPATGPPAAAVRLVAAILLVAAGALLTPLLAPLPAALRHRLTRRWARTVLSAFGVRVTVRAAGPAAPVEPGTGALVVANHISWLDIPLLACVFPGRVLAKSEIRGWPVIGALVARGGTLFVERERLRALPGTVRTLATALGAGSHVVVFPEGCTWCGRDQGPFTGAVFQAALDAGAPVQPVRIAYRAPDGSLSGAPAYVGDGTLPASLWRVAAAGGLTAEIMVLPPIPAGRHTDRRSLAGAARSAVVVRGVREPVRTATAAPEPPLVHTAVASDSANRPSPSVHQCLNSIPAQPSSVRTRS